MSFILRKLNELDLSFKMDLDFSDCFEGKKLQLSEQSQSSRSIVQDGSRFLGSFWKEKMHLITKLKKTIFVTFCLFIYMTKLFKNGANSLKKEFAPWGANSFFKELATIDTGGKYENYRVFPTKVYPFTINTSQNLTLL